MILFTSVLSLFGSSGDIFCGHWWIKKRREKGGADRSAGSIFSDYHYVIKRKKRKKRWKISTGSFFVVVVFGRSGKMAPVRLLLPLLVIELCLFVVSFCFLLRLGLISVGLFHLSVDCRTSTGARYMSLSV